MAGYTSTPRQYGEYIQPYNIELIAKSLSYKQDRNEAADAKLREEVNSIASMDIAKDVDKSYLMSRLTSMVGNVNNLGMLDLSDSGIVKNLDSKIQSSIDENVLNAYQSTKQIRAFQENIREIQSKQKELYNPLNEAYAMRPVTAYLNSDKVGESVGDFGALVYTPYVDIDGEVTAQMNDYVKNMKDGKIKVQGRTVISPDGKEVYDPTTIWEKDVRGMSDNEIKNFVSSMVTSKYAQQANINAWQRYRMYSPEGLSMYQNDVNSFINLKKNDFDISINKLETDLASVKDKGQDSSELDSRINKLKLEKNNLESYRKTMLSNPDNFGGELEKNNIVENLTTRYTPLLKKLDDSYVGKNEVYYAEQEAQYRQLDYEIKFQQLELQKQKEKREQDEFKLKASGQWKGGNGNNDGSSSNGGGSNSDNTGMSVGAMPTDTEKERDWEQEFIDGISDKNKMVNDMTKQTYEYVLRESKKGNKGAKALIERYDLQRKGKHNAYLFRQLYNTTAADSGINLVEDINGNKLFTKGDLSASVEEYNTIATRYKDIKNEVIGSHYNSNVNSSDFIKNIADEDNLMIATPTGLVNLKDLAIKRGVMDKNGNKLKDITSDAMINNTIKANLILGNMKVSNEGKSQGTRTGDLRDAPSRSLSSKDAYDLGRIYGEDLVSLLSKDGNILMTDLARKAPNTYKAIVNYEKPSSAVSLGSYNSPISKYLGTNNRLIQDSVFRNITKDGLLSNKTLNDKYRQELEAGLKGVGVDNAITMSNPKSEVFKQFANQITAFGRPTGNTSKGEIDNTLPGDIEQITYRVKNAKGELEATFRTKDKKGIVSNMTASILISDLNRNMPSFMKNLDFEEKGFYYSKKGMGNKKVSTSTDGISFVNPNADFIYNSKLQHSLQNEFGNLPFYPAIVAGVNKDSSKQFLFEQFRKDNGNDVFYKDIILNKNLNAQQKSDAIKQKEQQFNIAINNIVNNSTKYVLDAQFINDGQYALQLKDKNTGRAIAGIVQDGDNLKPVKTLLDDYESSSYIMFVTSMIEEEKRNMALGASDYSDNFKKLTGIQ